MNNGDFSARTSTNTRNITAATTWSDMLLLVSEALTNIYINLGINLIFSCLIYT